jgi:hypothetical protein
VLVHGFPDNLHLYARLVPRLNPPRRVITFDFPGWGILDKPAGSALAPPAAGRQPVDRRPPQGGVCAADTGERQEPRRRRRTQWITTYLGAVGWACSRATWPRRKGIVVSHDLKLERLFDASPEVVFGPKGALRRCAGPNCGAECGLRAGASGRSCSGLREPRRLARPTGSRWVGWPRRLVYRSAMTMPDGSSVDTGMEVTGREHDGRTRVTIVQGSLPAAGVRDEFAEGWASLLDGPGRAAAARVTDRS